LELVFANAKLEETCNHFEMLQKRYGERQAQKIRQRLDELRAFRTLADVSHLPPLRLHQLVGRKAEFSVDLVYPYRLILTPAARPAPRKPDHGVDLAQVTAVRILGVEDTHE
jgi:proteic killer suppression protein